MAENPLTIGNLLAQMIETPDDEAAQADKGTKVNAILSRYERAAMQILLALILITRGDGQLSLDAALLKARGAA